MGPAVEVSRRDRWRLGLAAGAVLLAAADMYVVVVALPSIMAGVGVGLDRLQRATPIVSGFLLGYTAVLPLIGRVADLAGTEPVFAGCLAAFASGSLITATAHALPVVVLGRAVQGLGGGGLVPVTMAMVAARWPPDARGLPLGIVGAVQELGSVIGPLYGAAIVSVASWRAIFWINIPIVAVVAAGFAIAGWRAGPAGNSPAAAKLRLDVGGVVLLVVGGVGLAVGLDAPARLATSASIGQIYAPVARGAWAPFTTPIVLVALGVLVMFAGWELAAPLRIKPLVAAGRLPGVLVRADLLGATLLAGVLACVVVAFSTANPSQQVIASSAPIVVPLAAVLAFAFVLRQRRAASPLIAPGSMRPRPAWGALLVNFALGGALMSALVDVPLFALSTAYTNSEVDSALVLVRFLVAVPIGALIGGALCRSRASAPAVAAAGMALATASFVFMTTWGATAMGGAPRWSDVELIVGGLGFGLAIAPINVAILGAIRPDFHALGSALAVVARTIGMLAGLSALTAVALHRFYQAQAKIGSPLVLCPKSPDDCVPYNNATQAALISELHTIFAGAAICTAVAGVLALVLLRTAGRGAGDRLTSGAAGTTT